VQCDNLCLLFPGLHGVLPLYRPQDGVAVLELPLRDNSLTPSPRAARRFAIVQAAGWCRRARIAAARQFPHSFSQGCTAFCHCTGRRMVSPCSNCRCATIPSLLLPRDHAQHLTQRLAHPDGGGDPQRKALPGVGQAVLGVQPGQSVQL